jgi:hypothetical protein
MTTTRTTQPRLFRSLRPAASLTASTADLLADMPMVRHRTSRPVETDSAAR